MTMFQPVSIASDRVMAALIAGLEIEFGHGVAEGLAHRFIEAEDTDFHWDARVEERWLGAFEAAGEDDLGLDCVAILGLIEGRWFVAICIVDGDGMAHGIMGRRRFSGVEQARKAFTEQR